MLSPARANSLGLILLLAGCTALAAEPALTAELGPASGGPAAMAVPRQDTARSWTARPASPQTSDDVFRPFDPPPDSLRRQFSPGGANSSRDGAATAGRDDLIPSQLNLDSRANGDSRANAEVVVPAAFQAPVAASVPAAGAASPLPPTAKPAASAAASGTPAVPEPAVAATSDPVGKSAPLPLKPRRGGRSESPAGPGRIGGLESLVTVGSSLAVVLGLFFIVAWFMRRSGPRGAALLPSEVVEVLGRAPLAGRQQMHLLRLGGKLVLVCLSPDGVQSLTEVTEPDEVTRLTGLCRQAQPNSATAVFRQVFQQFHTEARVSKFEGLVDHDGLPLTGTGFKSIQGGRLEDGDV